MLLKCVRRIAAIPSVVALAMSLHNPAFAQSADAYPAKPVRLICPFPPGGLNDLLSRYFAQHLTIAFGQQVFVDNRTGAGGVIGAEAGARSPADGYSIMLANMSILTINPFIYASLPYDSERSYAPVIEFAESVNLMLVNPALPVNSVRELIKLAAAKPGALNFASQGVGTPAHLAIELFNMMAGTKMTHIPYKGAGGAIPAVIAGEAQVYFEPVATTIGHVRSGKLRALAVTSSSRSNVLPQVPTVSESGLPGFDVSTWYGLVAPAGTPQPVIVRLNDAINRILGDARTLEYLNEQAMLPVGGTSAAFAQKIRNEMQRWGKVVKETKAKVD